MMKKKITCPKTKEEIYPIRCIGCEYEDIILRRCRLKISQSLKEYYQTEKGKQHRRKMAAGVKKFWERMKCSQSKK